jgi:hypothetical protein
LRRVEALEQDPAREGFELGIRVKRRPRRNGIAGGKRKEIADMVQLT